MATAKPTNRLLEMPYGNQVLNHWTHHRPMAMRAMGAAAQRLMEQAAEQAEAAFLAVRKQTGNAETAHEVAMHNHVLLPDLETGDSPDEPAITESSPPTLSGAASSPRNDSPTMSPPSAS